MSTTGTQFNAKVLQAKLITLGYLPAGTDDGSWGAKSKRALLRLQRRAATVYRISQGNCAPADCGIGDLYRGPADGAVTQATLDEVEKWLTKKWMAPLGRFGFAAVANGKLREDVAKEWSALVNAIAAKGGTIAGPYGNTKRALGKTAKVGASSYSFHIVGRAIDLRQEFANRSGRRYFVVKEEDSGRTLWRIYCSVESEAQGTAFKKGDVEYWDFVDKKSIKIPEGRYLDLTGEIMKGGHFERIPAQDGWQGQYNKTEWWHFQWAKDKQVTFQDECELVGISESELRASGYSDANLDRKPG